MISVRLILEGLVEKYEASAKNRRREYIPTLTPARCQSGVGRGGRFRSSRCQLGGAGIHGREQRVIGEMGGHHPLTIAVTPTPRYPPQGVKPAVQRG